MKTKILVFLREQLDVFSERLVGFSRNVEVLLGKFHSNVNI
jgi:hypothetical protein